jgi:protein-tyrosine phosphatase
MNPNRREDERQIELEGQDNFRDLGGYEAADGRRVKWRQLFRSGELVELSDGDLRKLSELGLRTVIDLRGVVEREKKGPDRLPAGAALHSIAIEPGDHSAFMVPAFASGEFSQIPGDWLLQINREYVRDWQKELGELLAVASDPTRRPLVFHCTQGKDRAGISAAILLSALGVPWSTVVEEYLLSNVQRHQQAEAGMKGMRAAAAHRRGVRPDEVDMTNIRGLFFVDGAYLGAAHDEITRRYGSLDSFIREGIGFSDSGIQRLRNELLE